MDSVKAVILAAGEGKRMKSDYSKLVHKLCGKTMIEWVCGSAKEAGVSELMLVVGHRADQVLSVIDGGSKGISHVLQEKQLGTGHAVMQAMDFIKESKGTVLVLCGDTPLIEAETLKKFINVHNDNGNSVTLISALLDDPKGYGRIVRDENGNVLKIVEDKDADPKEKSIREINSGMYCFDSQVLAQALSELKNDNSQGEYYLTDTIEIILNKNLKAGAYIVEDPMEIWGINDRLQLSAATQVLRKRINDTLMRDGVTFMDPSVSYIDVDVKIGRDTIIYPGCLIEGTTKIGDNCTIGPNSRIFESKIGNDVEIMNSVIMESEVDDKSHIGPFAYLRPQSKIGKKVKIGDFVEIKKATIGDKTKVSHLSYIGDAEIGRNVNVGCGVVVVNYDGKKKHKTIVEDNAFVGCNVNLISPVTVRENAYIAAGSTITDEVPKDSLAIARVRQEIKADWVSKKGLKREEKED